MVGITITTSTFLSDGEEFSTLALLAAPSFFGDAVFGDAVLSTRTLWKRQTTFQGK
jgi:hypothetical protein